MNIYSSASPIREAELHAYADELLPESRRAEVEAYLESHPAHRAQVDGWRQQNESIRALYADVAQEPIPDRLPLGPKRGVVALRRFAVAASIALVSGSVGWFMHGQLVEPTPAYVAASVTQSALQPAANFARRAAIAHVVYSPEVRRPVEVGADQEDQLVAWLSKRLGESLKPPRLQEVGYELIGGRLLPGEEGPVAQFMYHDASGQRLTLYVTREQLFRRDTAFRFAQEGPVGVFYWIDGKFGYAISGGMDKATLSKVAQVVHRQLS